MPLGRTAPGSTADDEPKDAYARVSAAARVCCVG